MGETASVPSPSVETTTITFEEFFAAEYRRLCEALVLLTGDPLEV